jgi:LAS superfamily LD-carboxypeptidase LdcB
MLEQKIAAAKQKRHKQYLKLVIAFTSVTLVCGSVIFFLSCCQISFKEDDSIFPEFSKDSGVKASVSIPNSTPTPIQTSKQIAIPSVAEEQLRLSYIKALSEYENNTKPKLEKIDLVNWDKSGANRLIILENDALTKFSLSDYAGALSSIDELSQLAKKMITDSQQQFSESLAKAKS